MREGSGWRTGVSPCHFVQDYFCISLALDNGEEDQSVRWFGHRGKIHSMCYNRDRDWIPGIEIRLMQKAMDVAEGLARHHGPCLIPASGPMIYPPWRCGLRI